MPTQNLIPLAIGGRPSIIATEIRERFEDYFNRTGALAWQNERFH